MSRCFTSIWYASQEKGDSIAKFIVLSDRGSLDTRSDEFYYRGLKDEFSMRNIVNMSLGRQRFAWLSYLIINVINVAILACLATALSSVMRNAEPLMVAMSLTPTVAIMVAGNLLGILVAMSTKWVLVEFEDEQGLVRKAYFADGSLLGWGGIFGGTRRLFDALQAQDTPQV